MMDNNKRRQLEAAHHRAFGNQSCIFRSTNAGCYGCAKTFPAASVTSYIRGERCALCPLCGIDSVIGDASGFPVTDTCWLHDMHERWFSRPDRDHERARLVQTGACDECGRCAVPVIAFSVTVAGPCENYSGEHGVCENCLRDANALFQDRAAMRIKRRPAAAPLSSTSEPVAAVALIWRQSQDPRSWRDTFLWRGRVLDPKTWRDAPLLTVWNKRYEGWSLPGGKVEDGETPAQAVGRELREETALMLLTPTLIFSGPHNMKVESTRGSRVDLFFCDAQGMPQEMEPGCPVKWMPASEFLEISPFRDFYKSVFLDLERRVLDGQLPAWILG